MDFSSLFGYCPLAKMIQSGKLDNQINRLHQRVLRLVFHGFWISFLEQLGGSGGKSPSKDMEKIFSQLSNLSQSVFVLEILTHWGLETAVCPVFVKPVLDVFAICSLVPRIIVSHTQQSYLCPKSPNCMLGKADLKLVVSKLWVEDNNENHNVQYFLCYR